ncbi:DNA-directed RNA polymerase subunit [Mycena kentingensis (nom. inval.)]|nr:DNA-directed RNA polymerase subunit [Mycena kentingensis (nom. inval.)]
MSGINPGDDKLVFESSEAISVVSTFDDLEDLIRGIYAYTFTGISSSKLIPSIDATAGGIDVQHVSLVINYDLPLSVDIDRTCCWEKAGHRSNFKARKAATTAREAGSDVEMGDLEKESVEEEMEDESESDEEDLMLVDKPPSMEDNLPRAANGKIKTSRAARPNIDLRASSQNMEDFDETLRKKIMATLLESLVQQQVDVNSFMDGSKNPTPMLQVKQGLEKEEGLFSKHMTGKRVNYAARSVLSPDVNIESNETGIPPVFAQKSTFPEPVIAANFQERRQRRAPSSSRSLSLLSEALRQRRLQDKLGIEQRTAISNQLLTRQANEQGALRKRGLDTRTPAINKVYRHLRDRARVLKGEKTIRMRYAKCTVSYGGDALDVPKHKHLCGFQFIALNEVSFVNILQPRILQEQVDAETATSYMKFRPNAVTFKPESVSGQYVRGLCDGGQRLYQRNPDGLIKTKAKEDLYQSFWTLARLKKLRNLTNVKYMRSLVEPDKAIGLLASQGIHANVSTASILLGTVPPMALSVLRVSEKASGLRRNSPKHCPYNAPYGRGWARRTHFTANFALFLLKAECLEEYDIEPAEILACFVSRLPMRLKKEVQSELKKFRPDADLRSLNKEPGQGKKAKTVAEEEEEGADDAEDAVVKAGRKNNHEETEGGDGDADDGKRARRKTFTTRATRSGAQFSPYELVLPNFDLEALYTRRLREHDAQKDAPDPDVVVLPGRALPDDDALICPGLLVPLKTAALSHDGRRIHRESFLVDAGSPVKRMRVDSSTQPVASTSSLPPPPPPPLPAEGYIMSTWDDPPVGATNARPKKSKSRASVRPLIHCFLFSQLQDTAMQDWVLNHRETFLETLLWLEGRGPGQTQSTCSHCGLHPPSVRCRDCTCSAMLCAECIVACHASSPLHWVEQWNGSYFQRRSLKSLGLRIQVGHPPGERCTRPHPAVREFIILHSNGIHEVALDYCACHLNVQTPHAIQLLRARLYPATNERPKTCATLACLDAFDALSLHSKASAYDYYAALEYGTNGAGSKPLNRGIRAEIQ